MDVWVDGNMISRNMLADGGFHDFSDLHLSFGLADATAVDSITIYWPSGIIQEFGMVEANQFITIIEDESVGTETSEPIICYSPTIFSPNQTTDFGSLVFSQANESIVNISIINSTGNLVKILLNEVLDKGSYEFNIDVSKLQSGIYFVKIVNSRNSEIVKVVKY